MNEQNINSSNPTTIITDDIFNNLEWEPTNFKELSSQIKDCTILETEAVLAGEFYNNKPNAGCRCHVISLVFYLENKYNEKLIFDIGNENYTKENPFYISTAKLPQDISFIKTT